MKFEMIGRLSMPKATEKFEPFVKKSMNRDGFVNS